MDPKLHIQSADCDSADDAVPKAACLLKTALGRRRLLSRAAMFGTKIGLAATVASHTHKV